MENDHKTLRLGIVGGGNMGSALIAGLLQHGISAQQIFVVDSNAQTCQRLAQQFGVQTSTDVVAMVKDVNVLLLAVKPDGMHAVVAELGAYLKPDQHFVLSIAAGITTEQLATWISEPIGIVRAMPNTPALLGCGITGLYATAQTSSEQKNLAEKLMRAVGEIVWIDDEAWMNIVTALSGSGPAYFFYLMEGLIAAATQLGLPNEIARKLTLQTALGSANLALNQPDVAALRQQVTSPGGTTEQGIKVLKDGKLHELLSKTLEAATLRCKALSENNNH